ncbi:MAG: hypothetical protein IJ168_10420 [Eubacterium sp.]|nr:hypothetical protein [Eubacterium sp.]
MNRQLDLLLDKVKEKGGDGRGFLTDLGDAAVIFFLNLQKRVYIASYQKEGYIVSMVINEQNSFGGAVSAFGHYCFAEPEAEVLQRLDDFYGKLKDAEFFDLQEEIRANNDIDLIIQSLAEELGFIV